MVEYAILMIVIVLLVAGGVEIALAAFGSQRTSGAAAAGIEQWVYAVGGAGVYSTDVYGGGVSYRVTASPIDVNDNGLADDTVGLGDHASGFTRPYCDTDASTYDDGLPADSTTRGGDAVYLFNPLPIDITDCIGQDGTDTTRSRQTVLVDMLPPLNRSLYSVYQKRCADADGNEVDCSDTASIAQSYLRLPGRLDTATGIVRLGFLDNDPASGTFQSPVANMSTFEIECSPAAAQTFAECDTSAAPADVCWDSGTSSPLACDIRIRLRYRYVFNTFLQYPFVLWNSPLPEDALAVLDTGPAGVQGVLGGEVGRGGARLFQRTFLGCWETVTTAPSASMQGNRLIRSCN